MAGKKPWAKLWVGWYHTADWLSLSLAEKGAWWLLYSLAQELEGDGRMVSSDGPMTLREISRALHLEERTDRDIFRRMINKRLAQGGLHWDGNILVLTEFATEQSRTPSTDKEAVKERVRRWRAVRARPTGASRHTPDARQTVTDNQLPAEGSEAEAPETSDQYVTDVTALPISPLSSVSQGLSFGSFLSACRAKVSSIIEDTREPLSQHEQIQEWLAEYGGELGFEVRKEYPVPAGRIDLVWLAGDEVAAGFEVDHRTPKAKSIAKLAALDACWKCILLRSERETITEEQGIHVIELTGKPSTTSDAEVAMVMELSRCYENNIGLLSATARELFDEFLEEYHGPIAWIADAFKEGVKYNHRNWAYISKILMNWQNEGRGERQHERPAERHAAPGGDPLSGARQTGWDVETVGEHDEAEVGDED